MENKLLIVFLSCKKHNELWNKLLETTSNSIIFYGDPEITEPFIYKNRILTLKCNDTYDFLPVKVYLMIKTVLKIPELNNFSHILKIDDYDTKINNSIHDTIKDITLYDYCGQHLHNHCSGNRKWHLMKCPENSMWRYKKYNGKYVPWLDGGCGYILSKKSLNIISNMNLSVSEIYKNYIYEDIMIALFLYNNNIFPIEILKIIKGDKF